jgi:hypothetical protein
VGLASHLEEHPGARPPVHTERANVLVASEASTEPIDAAEVQLPSGEGVLGSASTSTAPAASAQSEVGEFDASGNLFL